MEKANQEIEELKASLVETNQQPSDMDVKGLVDEINRQ